MPIGPLETKVDKLLYDAFQGDPRILEAAYEGREGLSFEETFRTVMGVVGAQNECLRLLAREIDRLPRSY